MIIKAISLDAAFTNMGMARVLIDPMTSQVQCLDLELVVTVSDDRKVVRKSSSDLGRAKILYEALARYSVGATIAFAEVPSGAQSAAAARGLGIAVGIIASCPVPLIEVSPIEVKRLFSQKGAVPKAAIIDWAVAQWPQAPWIRYKGRLTKANEHLADAMAVVMTGIKTPEFKRLMALQNAVPLPDHVRHSSRRKLLN